MKIPKEILEQQLSPETTIFFKETNVYHPSCIGEGIVDDFQKDHLAIVIEDWESGGYRFVNSVSSRNQHFKPSNQKPLKKVEDLNDLWKALTGNELTYIGG